MEKKTCPGEVQGHMGGARRVEDARAEQSTCPGKENAQAKYYIVPRRPSFPFPLLVVSGL